MTNYECKISKRGYPWIRGKHDDEKQDTTGGASGTNEFHADGNSYSYDLRLSHIEK